MAAVTSIMRAQQILLGELDALLRPYGLTFARYEALVLLTFSRRGALPLGLIGERLMVHPTSVTNIIDRLEHQQMVIRRPNPADGRGRLAEITEAGRAVVERATRDLMAAEFGLAGFEPGQLKEIFDLFRELRLAAGDFVPDPAAAAPAAPARRGPWRRGEYLAARTTRSPALPAGLLVSRFRVSLAPRESCFVSGPGWVVTRASGRGLLVAWVIAGWSRWCCLMPSGGHWRTGGAPENRAGAGAAGADRAGPRRGPQQHRGGGAAAGQPGHGDQVAGPVPGPAAGRPADEPRPACRAPSPTPRWRRWWCSP